MAIDSDYSVPLLVQLLLAEFIVDLLKLASRVDDSKEGAPSFLMVLTGQQAAYRRPDGVYVVPITCLAP